MRKNALDWHRAACELRRSPLTCPSSLTRLLALRRFSRLRAQMAVAMAARTAAEEAAPGGFSLVEAKEVSNGGVAFTDY